MQLASYYMYLANKDGDVESYYKCISCMQESLKVYTLDSDSYNYAVAYANIGKAYLLMSYLSQTNVNIDRALSAYEEALKVFKISQFPFNYASVQIDLEKRIR